MSSSRLLVEIEVLEFLRTRKRKEQEDLLKRFREIATYPSKYSDFAEYDSMGRRVDVHIYLGFAIKFWDDFADRHLKIPEIHSADLF